MTPNSVKRLELLARQKFRVISFFIQVETGPVKKVINFIDFQVKLRPIKFVPSGLYILSGYRVYL